MLAVVLHVEFLVAAFVVTGDVAAGLEIVLEKNVKTGSVVKRKLGVVVNPCVLDY